MARKPEVSLGMGLAVSTLVYATYSHGLPKGVDMRATPAGDEMLESVRKQNAWIAAGLVSGISLLAKDATIFVLGGATIIVLDWVTRANIFTNHVSNTLDLNPFNNQVNTPEESSAEVTPDLLYAIP